MKVSQLILAASLLAGDVSAFSASAPSKLNAAPAGSAASSAILDGLKKAPLIRAADSEPVLLPDQWRSGTPFGLADEVAVLAFLR